MGKPTLSVNLGRRGNEMNTNTLPGSFCTLRLWFAPLPQSFLDQSSVMFAINVNCLGRLSRGVLPRCSFDRSSVKFVLPPRESNLRINLRSLAGRDLLRPFKSHFMSRGISASASERASVPRRFVRNDGFPARPSASGD